MSDTRPKPENSKDLEAWRSEQRPSGSRQQIVPRDHGKLHNGLRPDPVRDKKRPGAPQRGAVALPGRSSILLPRRIRPRKLAKRRRGSPSKQNRNAPRQHDPARYKNDPGGGDEDHKQASLKGDGPHPRNRASKSARVSELTPQARAAAIAAVISIRHSSS